MASKVEQLARQIEGNDVTIRKLRREVIALEREVGTLCAKIMKLEEQLRNAGKE